MTTTPTSDATTEATSTSTEPEWESDRLHRGGDGRMLGGVAVGLADYFDVDPTLVRIGFVALTFLGGLAIPLYLAGWLLIPEEGSESSVAEELLHHERSR
jgi:phage shock protein PspC (stress-responsive transcriptional regulator)